MKEKRKKKLFVGDFRYNRELVTKHAFAFSGRQAKVFMLRQLAAEHGVPISAVMSIFDGSKVNFEIQVDPEWRLKNGM
uniref:Uncharacterized protein n=1 Tax=viral metagenome TaxID=1070528 RepID=A0A6M3L6P7_9ZZZZ